MVPRHRATSHGRPLSRTVLIRLRISSTVGGISSNEARPLSTCQTYSAAMAWASSGSASRISKSASCSLSTADMMGGFLKRVCRRGEFSGVQRNTEAPGLNSPPCGLLRVGGACRFIRRFAPVFLLTGFTDPRIHAVGGIVFAIEAF